MSLARSRRRRRKGDKNETAKKLTGEISIPVYSASMAHIELCGNCEAIVEGCRGVLEYNDKFIKLDTGRLTVAFSGSDLCLGTFQLEQTVIHGSIISIEFSN